MTQACGLFDGMAEGVAEIEYAPLTLFLFITFHDTGFDGYGVINQAFDNRPFQGQCFAAVLLEKCMTNRGWLKTPTMFL